jgi:hypothetical protein
MSTPRVTNQKASLRAGTIACPQPGIRRVRVNRWVVALAAVTIEVPRSLSGES